MANATSTFLQGANAANAAASPGGQPAPASSVDTVQVLAAISKPQVVTVADVAAALNITSESVTPVVEILSHEGLVETRDDGLHLSDSGERALRYAEIAKT
jgi:hypothetical protein